MVNLFWLFFFKEGCCDIIFFFFGLILNLDIVIGMVIVDKIEGVCLIDFFFYVWDLVVIL